MTRTGLLIETGAGTLAADLRAITAMAANLTRLAALPQHAVQPVTALADDMVQVDIPGPKTYRDKALDPLTRRRLQRHRILAGLHLLAWGPLRLLMWRSHKCSPRHGVRLLPALPVVYSSSRRRSTPGIRHLCPWHLLFRSGMHPITVPCLPHRAPLPLVRLDLPLFHLYGFLYAHRALRSVCNFCYSRCEPPRPRGRMTMIFFRCLCKQIPRLTPLRHCNPQP